MQTYKDLIQSKPSNALIAMIKGLRRQSERPDFVIKMSTYGEVDKEKNICFGCAATCVVQELRQVDITPENFDKFDHYFMSNKTDEEYKDLVDFERAMDEARTSWFESLFKYCDLDYPSNLEALIENYYFLSTNGWQEEVYKVEEVIEKLQELGY